MKKYFNIILFLCLVLPTPLLAASITGVFYVDATLGSDNSATTSGLATDNAWQTINQVNTFTRTNILTYSEQFNNAAWLVENANAVIADQMTAPDGTVTADLLIEDSTNTLHDIYHPTIPLTSGTSYAVYGYVKRASGTRNIDIKFDKGAGNYQACFDLDTLAMESENGTGTSYIIATDNGWFRIGVIATAGATGNGYVELDIRQSCAASASYAGDNTSGFYLWGWDVVAGVGIYPHVTTVATAVAAGFLPGDTISLKRGQSWAETLTVPSSGTAGSPITFGAYGTGAMPVIDAYDVNGQTFVTKETDINVGGIITPVPYRRSSVRQLQSCFGSTATTKYDIINPFYGSFVCYGTLVDKERCYLESLGCNSGTLTDGWACALGVTPGAIGDKIRTLCGTP